MRALTTLPVLLAAVAGATTTLDDKAEYVEIDYAKIDRKLAKEPTYVAEPRYALFVFGLEGKARMWAVLDKSDAESPYYDVLYLDLDADGDLTDDGERFQGTYNKKREASGTAMSITVGNVPVPALPTESATCTSHHVGWRVMALIHASYCSCGTDS